MARTRSCFLTAHSQVKVASRMASATGNGTFYYKSGGLKAVGKYADGELDGSWEWWRERWKAIAGWWALIVASKVGAWKRYYENGQLWDEGTYIQGKKAGEWKTYDKGGSLKQAKVFKAQT